MNKKLHVTKATTILTIASLAFTVVTASIAFALPRIPGTRLPDGGVYTGGGGPPATEPDDPYSKPRKPDGPFLDARTPTSITFHWVDKSSYELGYELYRGPEFGGPWTQLAVWGPGNGQTMSYTDYAVSRDTRYYYKVRVHNAYGESVAIQTFATIDGRVAVSRLQVRVRTANVSDANTDDDIHVSVNDYNMNYGTWLDYGQNDFERGDEFTYELLPEGVTDLSDINDIYLFKTGSDGWCIESLSLLVNGGVIYTQEFGSTPSTCRWLDNSGDSQNHYVVGRATLREHPLWQNFVPPLRTSIPKLSLGDFVEGLVGNIIHEDISLDTPVYIGDADPDWGHLNSGNRAVRVSRKDDTAVHIGFNLDVDILGPDNLDVDISFDVRLTGVCRTPTTPPALRPTIENIDAQMHVTSHSLPTSYFIHLAEGWVEDTIEENLKNFIPKLENDFPVDVDQVNCVIPSVDSEGNIDFTLTFVPRTGGARPPRGGIDVNLPPLRGKIAGQ